PRQRHRLRPLPLRCALGRPRAHPPRPVLVVAVADDERKRRAERPPVPEPGEHLDLVRLDLLARRAPVALLATAQVGVDRLALEDEPGRKPGDDGDERGTVRLAGRCQLEGHAREPSSLRRSGPDNSRQARPSARRIASTGAGTPVQRSNDAAPWARSTSSPSSTRAPFAAAASAVAVRGYG